MALMVLYYKVGRTQGKDTIALLATKNSRVVIYKFPCQITVNYVTLLASQVALHMFVD